MNDRDLSGMSPDEKAWHVSPIPAHEELRRLIRSVVGRVPNVGSELDALIANLPNQRVHRLETFANQVAKSMELVADKLIVSRIGTEEYGFLIHRIFENVTRDYQPEKLQAYISILVNALISDVPSVIQESYLARVESLNALHLRLLRAFLSNKVNAEKLRNSFDLSDSNLHTIHLLLPDFPSDQVLPCAHDLDVQGITEGLAGSLKAITKGYSSLQLENRLTPYGKGFLKFISLD